MKLQKRNLQEIYYCLYKGSSPVYDENGFETGELPPEYEEPVSIFCSISPAGGSTQTEMFGILESYDKIIITDDMTCPIDEHTVLFIDKKPENQSFSGYDYIVRKVAKSLNHISYAVAKADVS